MEYPHICSICGLPGAKLRDAKLEGRVMVSVYVCDVHEYEAWNQWKTDTERNEQRNKTLKGQWGSSLPIDLVHPPTLRLTRVTDEDE